jgi:MFS family permease
MYFVKRERNRLRILYDDYPRQFWVLVLGTFVDRVGGALLWPFFTLYITRKFGVGMTQVGVLFAFFSISSIVGSTLGGALTDHLGRKGMLIFGLVASATASLVMGVVDSLDLFFATAMLVGLLADVGGPAQQAMVADLLPESQRAQGFGILRVVANLAVTIGPAIGGLLAAQSYLLLFVCDATSSLITAFIVLVVMRETRPVSRSEEESRPSIWQTFRGYGVVARDITYMIYLAACTLMVVVYMQMNTTLSVYLRDTHGIAEQGFGYILSLNAAMVVLFQFYVTRRLKGQPPLRLMTAGTLLYAVGFSMYGFVSSYSAFLFAMVVITIGEMVVVPVSQAFVAQLAPEDMRGRYMAFFGFSWIIPGMVGPLLAGLIMDNADPRWVWYAAGIVGIVAAAVFALLHRREGRRQVTAQAGV